MRSVLDAALKLVAEEGLSALTLRPLAERCAISVATVSHYFGAKDDLIARLVAHVRELERTFQERWLARAGKLSLADRAGRAMLVEQALESWVTQERSCALFMIELIHARPAAPVIGTALRQWAADADSFWRQMAGADSALILPYILDEGAFSLGLGEWEPYRALRGLCIARLLAGVLRPVAELEGRAALFGALVDELAPGPAVDAPEGRRARADKRDLIAASTGALIVEGGAEAVTHRAAAAAAGVPASTVVYHFGAREDLVVAGLHAVVREFQTWIGQTRPPMGPDSAPPADEVARTRGLVRATATIALASVRAPTLRPAAADMRRRRGENIKVTILSPYGWQGNPERFDRLSAQVLSVCIFGARMLAMALGEPEDEALAAVLSAVARAD